MSIFAFGVKNVFFCLDLFHEISPFYDLFIPIFSILFIILLLEHTEYEKMCTAPLRDYRRLAVISVYFSVLVADLPLTLAFSPLVSRNCFVAFAARHDVFGAKYSHTFDRLPFGIFSVKRLMASSVCACSVKCCMLFTVIR